MRLVQIGNGSHRRIGIVEGSHVRLANLHTTVYSLAQDALAQGMRLTDTLSTGNETLDYDAIYEGRSPWRLLPPFDHPEDPHCCLVSGTGLTHKASAANRDAMHQQVDVTVSDSMRMYQSGLDGGSPAPGEIGAQPEWFYKGNGFNLRAHGEELNVPPFAEDGGEEPEIVGLYLIAPDGTPNRIGFTVGNEFSDHKLEQQNYLYLAHSKLRDCALGPELTVGDTDFVDISGVVSILREGAAVWSKNISSGERNMSHSLANLEHHHFKYEAHRRPGDVHIHFFGADAFSFGDGIVLETGDIMEISFPQLGRRLRNRIRIAREPQALVGVAQL